MLQTELQYTPFLTLLKKEVKRFLKVSTQTLLTPLVNSTMYLFIFGVSLGNYITQAGGVSYLEFLIPGLVMMGCLNNAFQNSASSIISSKFAGDLEDLKVAPISDFQIIAAVALGGLVRGLMVSAITFIVGTVFLYFDKGHFLVVQHPLWLFYFLILGGLNLALLGHSVAMWARNFDHMAAISSFVLVPLMYLGGVFFSLEALHPFWQKLSHLNPILYLINGVRFGVIGSSDIAPEYCALVALLSVGFFYLLAKRSMSWGSYSRW